MDEKQAWECFRNTGSVEAYLQYARLIQQKHQPKREETDADRYGRIDHQGESRG